MAAAKGATLLFLVSFVGLELLPEPCHALSFELRVPRSPVPKCPGHCSSRNSDCNSKDNSYQQPQVIVVQQDPYMLAPPMAMMPQYPAYAPPAAPSYEAPAVVVDPYDPPAPVPSTYDPPTTYNSIKPASYDPPPTIVVSSPYGSSSMGGSDHHHDYGTSITSSSSSAVGYADPDPPLYSRSSYHPPSPSMSPCLEQSRAARQPSYGSHHPPTPISSYVTAQREEYRPVYHTRGHHGDHHHNHHFDHHRFGHQHHHHHVDDYQDDLDDAVVYNKYARRSVPAAPMDRVSAEGVYEDRPQFVQSDEFRPYERERRSQSYDWANEDRDKLYMVYRADAGDDDNNNDDAPNQMNTNANEDYYEEDRADEGEVQSVLRKAVEIARQQREQRDNTLARHTEQQQQLHRYRYDQNQPSRPYSFQPDSLDARLTQQQQPTPRAEHQPAYSNQEQQQQQQKMASVEVFPPTPPSSTDGVVEQTVSEPSVKYTEFDLQPGVAYEGPIEAGTTIVIRATDAKPKTQEEQVRKVVVEVAKVDSIEEEIPLPFTEPTSQDSPVVQEQQQQQEQEQEQQATTIGA